MSDDDQYAENSGSDSDGIKNLRKQYEAEKKERAALQEQLDKFQKAQRVQTVEEILVGKGIPKSAAKLYNGEEVTEDAVSKWLTDHADVFHVTTTAEDENSKSADRVTQASFGNVRSIQNTPERIVGDYEEIKHAIETLPYEELEKLGYMPKSTQLYGRK